MSMGRLLLVDGHNLLFQMFYGMPSRIVNGEGKAIQGTLGFVGALLKIIRMTEPTHVAVIFDGEHENERSKLDPDYKGNRMDYSEVEESESPFSQLPDVVAALDYLGIRHAETTDCEADDVLAGYALTLGREMDVVIASFDSDLFQLLTDRVSVLRYRGERTTICTPDDLREKFGVSPALYSDFKSLTGDASDHIPGAPKVGPKTAAALLAQFGSLEAVLVHAEEIAKPSIRESIMRHAERLRINYRLIKLDTGAALPFSVQEMAYCGSGMSTRDVLRGIGLL